MLQRNSLFINAEFTQYIFLHFWPVVSDLSFEHTINLI